MSAQANHREIVTVGGRAVERLEFNGVPVVTFRQVDEVHGSSNRNAARNFNNNKKHFTEGSDYFVKNFHEAKELFGIIAPNGLTLLTESGYLMIAKSFTDDLAWKVQRQLVDSYFHKNTPQPVISTNPMDMLRLMFAAIEGQAAGQSAIKDDLEAVKREVSELKRMERNSLQMAAPQAIAKPVIKKVKAVRATKETRDISNPLYAQFSKLHKKRTLTWWKKKSRVPLALETLGSAIYRSEKVSPLTLMVICQHLKMSQDELKKVAAYLGIEDKQGHFNCYTNP